MLLAKTAELDRDELFAGLGPEPLDNSFTPELLGSVIEGNAHQSKRRCWTSVWLRVWGTSMFARPCFARAFRRSGLLVRWRDSVWSAWPPRSRRSLKRLSRPGARHCATMPRPMGNWDTSSITSRSTTAKPGVVPAKAAPAPCAASSNPAARPSTAPCARGDRNSELRCRLKLSPAIRPDSRVLARPSDHLPADIQRSGRFEAVDAQPSRSLLHSGMNSKERFHSSL